MTTSRLEKTVKALACLVLFALLPALLAQAQDTTKVAPKKTFKGAPHGMRPIIWDYQRDLPPDYPKVNPYRITVLFTSGNDPVLDHTGKPHLSGHAIQVIMDGGNGLQDPPRPDGSPGGDDSLAFGNLNMMKLSMDLEESDTVRSGSFVGKRYFVPLYPAGRAYFLRVWEGADVATAPYYQDTVEYATAHDRGGTMFVPKSGEPGTVAWKFGSSKPRPK